MSVQNPLFDLQALETFKESHPERGSVHQIVALPEDEFVQNYADAFNGDAHQARRVYQTAIALQNQSALVWANLKDLVSPFANNGLFNTIPASFLQHQESIPEYDRLFGNLDYIDCDPCRSVFGPAAYFVDLMQFVETFITERNPGIPDAHRLENRRRDLFNLKLDCANTNDLIAYIDLVNETLETIVATANTPDADQVLHDARFPSNLPYNIPLAKIRSYLSQLKLGLTEVYQTFETTPVTKTTAITREILDLSPTEFEIIRTELIAPVDLRTYYGLDNTQPLSSLAIVSTFLDKTGLNREELNDLIFQDLDRNEVNAGLSRLFFINAVEDGLGWLSIAEGEPEPNSFYQVPQERLVNLSSAKLDRIYRFVKLARKLGWSFADLDRALRSLQPEQFPNQAPEHALSFDGVNDFVTVENVTKVDLPSFTIEAWINPARAKTNPVLYKGDNITVDNPRIHFLFGLDTDNQLVFHTQSWNVSGRTIIPLGVFTHVAVTVSGSEVRFYINGKPEAITQATIAPIPAVGTTLNIGADLGYEFFAGSIQEVRIWQGVRTEAEIVNHRYCRLLGQEIGLVAYWPLIESVANQTQVSDRTANPNHGILGGAGAITQPQWVPQDLVLEPAAIALEQTAYMFNGDDQYLAIRTSRGLNIDASTDNQLTLEAWINLAENRGNTIFRLGSVNATDAEFEFGVTRSGDLSIAVAGTAQTSSNLNLPLNHWIHVAVVVQTMRENNRDRTQVRFYRNGQEIFLGSLPIPIVITDSDLEIGRNLRGDYFNGQLREVRFWNQARTAEEIQRTMDQVLPIRAEGLIGYWRLNQIEAGMAQDLSYNQNHLFLGGIPEDYMPDRILLSNRLLPPGSIATTSTVLDLDGSNDVIVLSNPQNAGLGQHERLTLELWFKPANLAARSGLRQVIYTQGDARAGLNLYLSENRLYVLIWCEADAQQVLETIWRSQPLDEQWHHLAITYDTTRSRHYIEFQAYLNGNTLAFESSNHPNTANLEAHQNGYRLNRNGVTYLGGIGAGGITRFKGETAAANPLHYFAGQITDVRLWNRIKSEPEIQQERFAAPDPNDASLISYLPMTEGQGLIVSDPSSQRNNLSQGALQVPDLILNGERIELRNVHSYYDAPEALTWTNYVYTGRLSLTDASGAIGVSFLNRNPANQNQAYILRRTAQQPTFHLETLPNDTQSLTGSLDSGVNPDINVDYRFRIEVLISNDQTTIRAKVWQADTPEPNLWQINAQDNHSARPVTGTVGIWAADRGSKFFANLQVDRLVLGEAIGISPRLNPSDWRDTAANFSTTPDDVLFNILPNRNSLFGTESNEVHIHSHYAVSDALTWTNYTYSGRLQTTDPTGAIGVTFFSRYPDNQTRYYRLRAWGQQFPFALETRAAVSDPQDGSLVFKGTVNSGVPLLNNVWYRFRIEVEDTSSQTNIRAKVWREDELEPVQWQIDAYDDRPNLANQLGRLRSGTIGLWAANPGAKLYDDLRVYHPMPLLSATPTAVELSRFQTVGAPVTAPWVITEQYPVLLQPLNRRALRFDGQRDYLATALTGDRAFNLNPFTIEAWVQLDRQQPNPVFSWQSAAEPPQTIWFGVNNQNRLAIVSRINSDITEVTGTAAIAPGGFTHIAASVNGTTVTFYVNGVEDAPVTAPTAIALNATLLELGRDGATQYFAGQIQDVRIWKTIRTANQFAPLFRYQQPDPTDLDLVAYWSFPEADGAITHDASNRALDLRLGGLESARRPILILPSGPSIIANLLPAIALDESTLTQLATIRQLQTRHNLPIDRLTALWFEIPHTGRDDGQTLFDRVFNGRGITGEVWNYTQYPIRWTVTGQSRGDREIRSRLMGALQVSSEELDRLVQQLSQTATQIELDGFYLTRLYRLSQIPKALRLSVQDFLRLLALMNLTEVNTLTEFKQVSDRANWLQRTGIQVRELEFLILPPGDQIPRPYTNVAIRDMAATLTNQSSEFLVTGSSFVSDLVNLSQSIEIVDSLKVAGIVDELGAVVVQYQPPMSLPSISGLPDNPDLRQMIQTQVGETLTRMQQEHANAVVERLSELFQVEPERLRIVNDRLNVTPSTFLGWMQAIAAATDTQTLSSQLIEYLNQLTKGLYLITWFDLTTDEAIALLQNPNQFSVTDVFNPTIVDLEHLMMFTELKTAFNDINGGLIHIFTQVTDLAITEAILGVTSWDSTQLTVLTNYFENQSTANQIPELHRLYRAFALADTLQVDVEFLIQLANTENLTFGFYRQQSDALLNVVRSRYDDQQWQRVYQPIRDRLATQRRDALLSYALTRQLPDTFQGRRDADVFYEYLLLDVQIGSEVDTSQILQGTAALQLYVQRCLLNLEQGVNPATIPLDQWNWMKNYRVWEANRKVFLYPESYIEPELRDTKTPEFEELEQELLQGELNQENVEKAFHNYLNKVAELADLKIVGSYLHEENGDRRLYLVGQTITQPAAYYYRELEVNTDRWLPWKKINLTINAAFVTPVYAFNRLFLFWVEFTEVSRQIRSSQASRTVYQPTIRFSCPDFNSNWMSPQTYVQDSRELEVDERFRPEWQRVYAVRTFIEIPYARAINQAGSERRERILVIYGDLTANESIFGVRALRNAREQEEFTLRFGGTGISDTRIDISLTPEFLGRIPNFYQGYITLSWQSVLAELAGNPPNDEDLSNLRSGLRNVLNRTFGNSNAIRAFNVPDNFSVKSVGSNQWFITYGDNNSIRLLVQQEELRLDVYQFSDSFLQNALNRLTGANLSLSNVRIENRGSNHWLIIANNESQRFLLLARSNNVNARNGNVYRLSTAQLYLSQTASTSPGINEYALALTPLESPGTSQVSLFNQLPLEASFLGVNNQQGWYILNTGEEQYLLRGEPASTTAATRITTDAERLAFPNPDQGIFTFRALSAFQNTQTSLVFRTERLDTTAVRQLNLTLFAEGIDGLLSLRSQQIRERNFVQYGHDQGSIVPPRATVVTDNRGQQRTIYRAENDTIDFNGAFGPYYQEIFFHIPFFIANQLNANQNFAEAQKWYHYIFNPTAPESNIDTASLTCSTTAGYLSLNHQTLRIVIEQNQLNVYNDAQQFLGLMPLANQGILNSAVAGTARSQDLEDLRSILNNLSARPTGIARLRLTSFVRVDNQDNQWFVTATTSPDRYWQYLPFHNLCVDSITRVLDNQAALAEYRNDPFDPHAIARLRVNAYQKAIVMKYIDNLLDWGDYLFNQNNRESIGEVAQLYVLAHNLLGPRPEGRANRKFEEIGDYNAIRQVFNNNSPDFLTEFSRSGALSVSQNGNIVTTFCVTENADFAGFWDRVSDRLFKIRHSLNIDGTFRQLDLFQAPLDVRALVAAFASGNRDISSILADINRPVPHYRYGYMLDRAKEMTEIVIGLGEKLLEAIQNRDAEQLATLQNTHERNILDLMTATRQAEIEVGQQEIEALAVSKRGIENRQMYYDNLVSGGTAGLSLNGGETTDLLFTSLALATGIAPQIYFKMLGSALAIIEPMGALATSADLAGDAAGAFADGLTLTAQLAEKIGAYERRLAEWKQERSAIAFESQEIDQQIEIANIRLRIAEHELTVHQRSIEQNQEIHDFYRRKFTNEQLYNWMISRISGLYFQAYKLAYATAKDAERAFQYEFGDDSQFINFGHWDSLRRGLLAGESLQLDLMRLEKYAIDQDSRYQEIEKIISLRSALPEAFAMLRSNSNCFFNLTERMFDEDYPGHFFRIIKSIAISVQSPALSPNQSLNATLIQLNNRALLEPDIEGVRYLMDGANQTDDIPGSIRSNWRANQQIAVSRPNRDNGMFGNFDLNFRFDDRYFPFEGTGAVSSWELEMPQASQFLAANDSDIIIHLKYTSRSDRGAFRRQVQAELR